MTKEESLIALDKVNGNCYKIAMLRCFECYFCNYCEQHGFTLSELEENIGKELQKIKLEKMLNVT